MFLYYLIFSNNQEEMWGAPSNFNNIKKVIAGDQTCVKNILPLNYSKIEGNVTNFHDICGYLACVTDIKSPLRLRLNVFLVMLLSLRRLICNPFSFLLLLELIAK